MTATEQAKKYQEEQKQKGIKITLKEARKEIANIKKIYNSCSKNRRKVYKEGINKLKEQKQQLKDELKTMLNKCKNERDEKIYTEHKINKSLDTNYEDKIYKTKKYTADTRYKDKKIIYYTNKKKNDLINYLDDIRRLPLDEKPDLRYVAEKFNILPLENGELPQKKEDWPSDLKPYYDSYKILIKNLWGREKTKWKTSNLYKYLRVIPESGIYLSQLPLYFKDFYLGPQINKDIYNPVYEQDMKDYEEFYKLYNDERRERNELVRKKGKQIEGLNLVGSLQNSKNYSDLRNKRLEEIKKYFDEPKNYLKNSSKLNNTEKYFFNAFASKYDYKPLRVSKKSNLLRDELKKKYNYEPKEEDYEYWFPNLFLDFNIDPKDFNKYFRNDYMAKNYYNHLRLKDITGEPLEDFKIENYKPYEKIIFDEDEFRNTLPKLKYLMKGINVIPQKY